MFRPIGRDWHVTIGSLRDPWIGRRVAAIGIAALAAYVLYAWLLFPVTTARVRIGMDLTVGGVTRSASNVVELRSRAGLGLAGLSGPTSPVIRGEAVTLTLGRHALLVMLLKPVDPTVPPDWPLRQLIAAAGGDAHGPLEAAIAWLARQSGRFDITHATTAFGSETRPLHPDLIFLPDRRLFREGMPAASAWRAVDPDAVDAVIGTDGARLVVWLEPVARVRPITRGDLALHLPAFELFWLRHVLSERQPEGLRPANFKGP